MIKKRVLILGAAGRDFHDFNMVFRNNPAFEVIGFTATQIPGIEGRIYPPALSGSLYPEGIPIYPESQFVPLIRDKRVDQVVFAYSDVSHETVMHLACQTVAAGADFVLLGTRQTQLKATKPVVSVGAVRTGAGKSQTSRRVCFLLHQMGYRVAAIRHPMPYGDLARQVVQRFSRFQDLEENNCAIEEREEYEPYLEAGQVVFAGVDYQRILHQAEQEADILVWDGGNNDLPFLVPDFHIVVVDPHRAGHESRYYPGEANARLADVFLINKVDTAPRDKVVQVRENLQRLNPRAEIIEAASPIHVDKPAAIKGKRVLVVEDGPTLTHGGLPHGAGWLAARRFGAAEIVDPRPYAVGSLSETFRSYPSIGPVLPAMGYGKEMIKELEQTINQTEAEVVVVGTPVDLGRFLTINKPLERARYELQEIGSPNLEEILGRKFMQKQHPNLTLQV